MYMYKVLLAKVPCKYCSSAFRKIKYVHINKVKNCESYGHNELKKHRKLESGIGNILSKPLKMVKFLERVRNNQRPRLSIFQRHELESAKGSLR